VDHSIIFPHVEVGRHSRISRAIIDKEVCLPEKTVIGFDPEEDRRRFQVTESGIVVVSSEDLRREHDRDVSRVSASGGEPVR
jgi:glucose-1-phosphate adenylyltransferase